jgi:hypothetical protein
MVPLYYAVHTCKFSLQLVDRSHMVRNDIVWNTDVTHTTTLYHMCPHTLIRPLCTAVVTMFCHTDNSVSPIVDTHHTVRYDISFHTSDVHMSMVVDRFVHSSTLVVHMVVQYDSSYTCMVVHSCEGMVGTLPHGRIPHSCVIHTRVVVHTVSHTTSSSHYTVSTPVPYDRSGTVSSPSSGTADTHRDGREEDIRVHTWGAAVSRIVDHTSVEQSMDRTPDSPPFHRSSNTWWGNPFVCIRVDIWGMPT